MNTLKQPASDQHSTETPALLRGLLARLLQQGQSEPTRHVLGDLTSEPLRKLLALSIAGRKGQSIDQAFVEAGARPDAAYLSLLEYAGSDLREELRRGYSIACATGFDIETVTVDWSSHQSRNVVERAWLSFGKQLAASNAADWKCFTIVDDSQQRSEVTKIYMQHTDESWWSFGRVLDRPTSVMAQKSLRRLAQLPSMSVRNACLPALPRLRTALPRRALLRLWKSVDARTGMAAGELC